jgi:hypothetical protein
MTRPEQRVSLNVCDNWDEHPELLRGIAWATADGREPCIVFQAVAEAHQWCIRINNFPDEPAFTLLVDGGEVIHFDEWPKIWGDMPHLPKGDSPNAAS